MHMNCPTADRSVSSLLGELLTARETFTERPPILDIESDICAV